MFIAPTLVACLLLRGREIVLFQSHVKYEILSIKIDNAIFFRSVVLKFVGWFLGPNQSDRQHDR